MYTVDAGIGEPGGQMLVKFLGGLYRYCRGHFCLPVAICRAKIVLSPETKT